MVEVRDGSNNLVQTSEYDGLNQRIVRSVYNSGGLSHRIRYYYNERWQILEERKEVSGVEDVDPLVQYVWHPYYIDALAIRFYDDDTDGTSVEHRHLQDANFNVTAVTDNTGAVLERCAYTPYGEVKVLDDNFAADTDDTSDIGNTHLYTGRERDPETGLQLNRHRYYAFHLGIWSERDLIGYVDGLNLYAAYFVPGDVDPTGTKKQTCLSRLAALCKACCRRGSEYGDCAQRARRMCRSMSDSWRKTKENPGPNTSKDEVHGYLCWDWGDAFCRTCDKHGGRVWHCEHRSIVKGDPNDDKRDPVHHYARFCACSSGAGQDAGKCCIDIDDGWFDGKYYHPPGKLDSTSGWQSCPTGGRGDDHVIPIK